VFVTRVWKGMNKTCRGCALDASFSGNHARLGALRPVEEGMLILYSSHNYKIGKDEILCCQRCDSARIRRERENASPG
jgi:hypothetical protein